MSASVKRPSRRNIRVEKLQPLLVYTQHRKQTLAGPYSQPLPSAFPVSPSSLDCSCGQPEDRTRVAPVERASQMALDDTQCDNDRNRVRGRAGFPLPPQQLQTDLPNVRVYERRCACACVPVVTRQQTMQIRCKSTVNAVAAVVVVIVVADIIIIIYRIFF